MAKGDLVRIWYNSLNEEYTREEFGSGQMTGLVFDNETKIVYYKFNGPLNGFMSPYFSENGKLCRFIDNQIVEIG